MAGWDETVFSNGTGSHSYVLENGDISTSPPAGQVFPLMYTAVPKDTPYSWANRQWFVGSFEWWGNATYNAVPPGVRVTLPPADTGWGLKFFEGPTAP
jgi:hypothetical protein